MGIKFASVLKRKQGLWLSILLLIHLASNVESACDKGCISCDSAKNECLICDPFANYQFNADGSCEKMEVENCKVLDSAKGDLNCLQCESGLFFDSTTKKCTEVPSNFTVLQCQDYNETGGCITCNKNYYIDNGNCLPVAIEVDGCLLFTSANTCAVCEKNTRYEADSGTCIDFKPSSNCATHSLVTCDDCLSGYVQDRNSLYTSLEKTNPSLTSIIFYNTNISFDGNYASKSLSNCIPAPYENCLTYVTSDEKVTGCETCSAGFYLNPSTKNCDAFPEVEITNCLEYSNGTTCSKCADNFYLNINECTAITVVDNCLLYTSNADTCSECLDTHYLNTTGTPSCTARTVVSVANCLSYVSNDDKCSSCADTFVLTDDGNLCLPEIANCGSYEPSTGSPTELLCLNCNTNYYVSTDKKSCLVQKLDNCLTHVANENSCATCLNGFYLTGTTTMTCLAQNLSGCETYVTASQVNECLFCNNLFSLVTSDNTCLALTDTNCAKNTQNLTTCESCKPGFYLDSAEACVASTKTVDPLCSEYTDDGECIQCIYGYLPFQLNSYLESYPSGCVAADASTGNCTQCDQNMDGTDNSGNIECASAANTSLKCKQLKVGTAAALGDNDSDCALCRTPDTHYLTSNTCTDRSLYKTHKCQTIVSSADLCIDCALNSHLSNLSETSAFCLDTPSVFTLSTIADCRIYDFFNDGKCLMCEQNFTLTVGSPDTCVADTGTPPHEWDQFHIDFNNSMEITKGLPAGATAIANCEKHYYNYEDSALQCAKCSATFTPVIEVFDSAKKNTYFPPDDNNILTSSYMNKIVACETLTDADYMQNASGSSLSVAANCAAAYDFGGIAANAGNYICLACASGTVGIPKTMGFDKTGADTTTIISWVVPAGSINPIGYAQCDTDSTMSKVYKRLQYSNSVENYSTTFSEIMYDTCTDSTMNVVHIRENNSSFFTLGVEGPSGSERPNSICQTIPAMGLIDNCQVYTVATDTGATRDLSLEEDYLCLACKPGFLFAAGAEGEECLPIQNCNLSGANTWMNGCETCDDGYTWPIIGTIPSFTVCNKNAEEGSTDCLLNSPSNNKCILCKNNKTLNFTTLICEDFSSTCATNGFPESTIGLFIGTDAIKNLYQNLMLYFFLDNYKMGPSMCASCASSKMMYMAKDSTDAAKNICISNNITQNLVPGCLVSNASGNVDKCLSCESQYILKNNVCELRTDDEQDLICDERNTSNQCIKCKNSYYPDSSGNCVYNENCLDSSDLLHSYDCSSCKEGYKIDSGNAKNCVPIEDSSTCLSYNYVAGDSTCNKCLDCNQTPIRKLTGSTESAVYCVNNQSSYSLGGYKLYYDNAGQYHKGEYSTMLEAIPSGKYLKTTFGENTPIAEYVCVRGPNDHNCTAFDSSNLYSCTACAPGYYLDSIDKRCKMGTIPGCLIYSSENVCTSCAAIASASTKWKTYYLTGNNCLEHDIMNCDVFSSSSNACTNCKNGYNLDGTECKANVLATNCQNSTLNTDTCVTCSEKYYLNTSTLCEIYTVTNCSSFNSTADECTSCVADYYLDNGNCLENTAPNCTDKSTISNSCTTCPTGNYYSDGLNGCVDQPEVDNCQSYISSYMGCDVCNTGFFKENGKCEANPSGIPDCVVYSSATACTTCASTHFFNGTSCELVTTTITQCAVYSADGICSACNPLYFLKADGTACDSVNITTCATWTDVDNCATCAGNNVLKANSTNIMECVASELDHCITPVAGDPKNTCTLCSDGFILKDNECTTPQISITNCRVYDPETEKCVECYTGKVLSADKSECLSKISDAGSFCTKAHIKSDTEPTCNLCEFGYSKNADGDCEACGGEGCFMCDSTDLTKCKVCSTDYYMTSSGSCSLNDPPEPESITLMRFFSIISLLLLVLKQQ